MKNVFYSILQISNHKNPEPVVKTPISIIYIGFLHKCKFKFVHFMDFFLNINFQKVTIIILQHIDMRIKFNKCINIEIII